MKTLFAVSDMVRSGSSAFTFVEFVGWESGGELVVLAAVAARHAARLVQLRDQLEPHGYVVTAIMAFQMGVLLASCARHAPGQKNRVNTFSLRFFFFFLRSLRTNSIPASDSAPCGTCRVERRLLVMPKCQLSVRSCDAL